MAHQAIVEVGEEEPAERARALRAARDVEAAERERRDADQVGSRIRERPAARERLVDGDLAREHEQDRAQRKRHPRAAQRARPAAAEQQAAERDDQEGERERARERGRQRRGNEQPRPAPLGCQQREQAEGRAERERVLAGGQEPGAESAKSSADQRAGRPH